MNDKHAIYADAHEVGGMTADYYDRDPKRLTFVTARYKHTARILHGYGRVLEVGCSDAFASRIVRQHVGFLLAVDNDPAAIREAENFRSDAWRVEHLVHDILKAPLPGFDAVYALDVLEHMNPMGEEETFLRNLRACAPVAVIGAPSLESQEHASALSRQGHVNCMTGPQMKASLRRFWGHVFMFGMNDETIHTGHDAMCHYRLAVCAP